MTRVDVSPAGPRPAGLRANSVRVACVLPDGTIYMSTATLAAASKGITVTVQNSAYVKGGG